MKSSDLVVQFFLNWIFLVNYNEIEDTFLKDVYKNHFQGTEEKLNSMKKNSIHANKH